MTQTEMLLSESRRCLRAGNRLVQAWMMSTGWPRPIGCLILGAQRRDAAARHQGWTKQERKKSGGLSGSCLYISRSLSVISIMPEQTDKPRIFPPPPFGPAMMARGSTGGAAARLVIFCKRAL